MHVNIIKDVDEELWKTQAPKAAAEIYKLAVSLGGVETLVTRPATTSHSGLCPEERLKAGVTDSLIRVSVGIEAAEDLIADFDQALEVRRDRMRPCSAR